MITGRNKKIRYVSKLFSGKTHDYEVLKECLPTNKQWFAKKTVLVDLGFLGINNDYEIEKLFIPHKKKRVKKGENNELNQVQKDENRQMSKERVGVEHAIGQIKRCKFLSQTIRVKKLTMLDQIVGVAAGIANFRNT
jgi:DDE superfamily endonuclease